MLQARASPALTPLSDDAAVRATDSDALVSRHYAHSLGYLDDPAASHFLSPSQRRAHEQRPPLINIGTHARTWAIDALVDQFLDAHDDTCQVLSLGAGTDSRFWRLKKERQHQASNAAPPRWPCANWVEVDFPEQTAPKARAIATKPDLKSWLGSSVRIERGGLGLSAEDYTLLPGDLRHLDQLSDSLLVGGTSTTKPPLDRTLPTLLLLECVLVYLEPEITSSLLTWFCETFHQVRGSAIVGYDPFRLQDQFGTVMKRNLAVSLFSGFAFSVMPRPGVPVWREAQKSSKVPVLTRLTDQS